MLRISEPGGLGLTVPAPLYPQHLRGGSISGGIQALSLKKRGGGGAGEKVGDRERKQSKNPTFFLGSWDGMLH